jgi:hypothetical protein
VRRADGEVAARLLLHLGIFYSRSAAFAFLNEIHQPGRGDYEQRREEYAEQGIEPDQRDVERDEAE